MKKQETLFHISGGHCATEEQIFNAKHATEFIMPLIWQFRDSCHLLEAQRLIGARIPVIELDTIRNNESVTNKNVRMQLWQQ